jgi:hypothetical protein
MAIPNERRELFKLPALWLPALPDRGGSLRKEEIRSVRPVAVSKPQSAASV